MKIYNVKISPFKILLRIFIFSLCLNQIVFPNDKNIFNHFDGQKAMDLLNAQCSFGPRVPDTIPHSQCLSWMEANLKKNNWETRIYTHQVYSNLMNKNLTLKNLFGIFNPKAKIKIMFSTHWDTRPIADKETDPALQLKPILGANDGASGTAILLELARVVNSSTKLKDMLTSNSIGIILGFYDGEDLGSDQFRDDWCLGSKAFARSIPSDMMFSAGVNIDMVGDKDLQIYIEIESKKNYPKLTRHFWAIGMAESSSVFIPEARYSLIDDHLSFLYTEIPYINVIDFTYTYWHTHADTPDKCSSASLQIIGNTLLSFLKELIKNPKKILDK